jgi:hypothetical protein
MPPPLSPLDIHELLQQCHSMLDRTSRLLLHYTHRMHILSEALASIATTPPRPPKCISCGASINTRHSHRCAKCWRALLATAPPSPQQMHDAVAAILAEREDHHPGDNHGKTPA